MTKTETTTQGPDALVGEEQAELRKVTISMPAWMLEDLRHRARARSITVTELIRRGVALEKMLFEDSDTEVVLRNQRTGKEQTLRLI